MEEIKKSLDIVESLCFKHMTEVLEHTFSLFALEAHFWLSGL